MSNPISISISEEEGIGNSLVDRKHKAFSPGRMNLNLNLNLNQNQSKKKKITKMRWATKK